MQWNTIIAKDWRNHPASPSVKTSIQEVQTQFNSLQGKELDLGFPHPDPDPGLLFPLL